MNLSHTIRKFNRFELKYLVPIRAAEAFRHDLRAHLAPDEHGDAAGSYRVSSLYYDGPDLRFYREKVDGLKFRRKLRIRAYEAPEPLAVDVPVYVEIKQRVKRVTQKRRVRLPYGDALRLCDRRQRPGHAPEDEAVVDEVAHMLWCYDLRPSSIVSYTRQALVGAEYDIGLRVTFDTDLSYRADGGSERLRLNDPGPGLPLFPANWAVVEIKVNERIPYWLTELVAVHNLNLVRVSKYCRSIELAHNWATPAPRLALA